MNGTVAPSPPRVSARQVAERLRELRGWAAYIAEALREDPEWEPGRMETLERVTTPEALAAAQEEAETLHRRLRELVRLAEGHAFAEPEGSTPVETE